MKHLSRGALFKPADRSWEKALTGIARLSCGHRGDVMAREGRPSSSNIVATGAPYSAHDERLAYQERRTAFAATPDAASRVEDV
jgi:hypothetical protein